MVAFSNESEPIQTESTSQRALTATPPPNQSLPRALYLLVILLIIAHTAFNGIRVTTSLAALKAGGGALWVGILTAMFNLIPAFLAIRAGRAVDRLPLRKMLVFGCVLMALSGGLAAFEPMLWVLAIAACGLGVGWMVIAAASQYAVGKYGGDCEGSRIRAFSVMSIGFSISSFLGPLIAGLMIDQVSFRASFALLATFPILAGVLFYLRGVLKLPSIEHKVRDAPPGKASDLLQIPIVRNTLMTGAVITIGWDLYIFLVPVLGSQIGLTATQIGSVMSLFAIAVFVVRFLMPRLQAWLGGRGVIVAAMIVSGASFIAFAFAHSYAAMLGCSFVMGLGLGSSQPIVLAFLHSAAPPHRIGEVNGLRMTMISTSQWTMPLVFGILSVKTGMLPLFLLVGGGLLSGSWFAKKKLP